MQTEAIENQPIISKRIETQEVKQVIKRRAYARVSTREQVDGYGIDVQITKIKDYLKLYDQDPENLSIHIDEGISAKNMKRPQLQQLIQDIKNGDVNEVIIYKLDRLARDVVDVYSLINLMQEYNCNLVSVMDHLDIHTANGRMVTGILAVIAQWERETDSERTVDSIEEQLEEGQYPHGIQPFGYSKQETKKLAPDPKQAEAINYIVNKACDGKVLSEIAMELELETGIRKREDQLRDILLRDYYATGEYIFEGKIYKDIYPELVSFDRLKMARKVLNKRAVLTKNDKYHYHNKVRDTEGNVCNCKPTKKKTHHIYYYEYGRKRINQRYLDEQVLFRMMIYANEQKHTKANKKIRKQILQLEKKMERAYVQYSTGKLDVKSYGYTMQQLHKELEYKRTQEYVLTGEDLTLDKWNELTDHEQAVLIDEHISSIIVDLDLKIVVKINFK